MCGFKLKVKAKDFIAPNNNQFRKGWSPASLSKSRNLKRGSSMENQGGHHDIMSIDMTKHSQPDYYSKHKKGKAFTGVPRGDAQSQWDGMDIANRVEVASNTGMKMSGFIGKSKGTGYAAPKGFKELSTPNKKAVGKYFGVI